MLARMLLATLCGCAIGFGRARKNRNAGLRTYVLVSIGSALTMMISAYEYEMLKGQWEWVSELVDIKFDGTRFAAQVIAGIGFLAAGTILSVGHQQISGLTTAIGLFASAALGIAAGAGFFEGAVAAAILVLVAEIYFADIGSKLRRKPEFHIQITYQQKAALDHVLRDCKDNRFAISNLQVTGIYDLDAPVYTAMISLRSRKFTTIDMLLHRIEETEGVLTAEAVEV